MAGENEPAPRRSFMRRAFDAARDAVHETKDAVVDVANETREDAGNLREKHIQPFLDAGKNRIIGAGAGAKLGFVIGMKGGPKGMAIGTAFGAVVGLVGGKPAVEGIEKGLDKLFGPVSKSDDKGPETANDNSGISPAANNDNNGHDAEGPEKNAPPGP